MAHYWAYLAEKATVGVNEVIDAAGTESWLRAGKVYWRNYILSRRAM
ncbi:MAG: hypothetical protein HY649_11780 [Acidobacteria bacterium]|nr:hypothetical protein [Acidobacteriota bacterium]